MNDPRNDMHPIAAAMEWVSVAMAVAVMMVLPGLGGQWLDKRLGTGFLALVGFGLGLASGIYYLLAATARMSKSQRLQPKFGQRHPRAESTDTDRKEPPRPADPDGGADDQSEHP